MSDVKLTKESDFLICLMYKTYLDNRNKRVPKAIAKRIGSSKNIHETLLPEWLWEDVDETCLELSRANLLKCFSADDCVLASHLTDDGIIYMENRFKNNTNSVLEYLAKIKSAIPFI